MGWEKRGDQRYYYAKKRNGKRIVSQYWGSGEVAQAVATLNQLDYQKKQFERDLWQIQKQNEAEIDQALNEIAGLIRILTKALLINAGFHTHKRQWRKKRV